MSLSELAGLVRAEIPEAEIGFEAESGGKEISGNYLVDNARVIEEFGLQYAPLSQRVAEVIADIRRDLG